jgi:hypothetical protein
MATPDLPPEFASAITPLTPEQRANARTLFDAAQGPRRVDTLARPVRLSAVLGLVAVGALILWWAWR